MYKKNRNAFTMIELVFVIVVVGILSAIAIPKFAATRDDAVITKARTEVASVRSALSTERQKRILRGDFNSTLESPSASEIFTIKAHGIESILLEYDVKHCPTSGTKSNCWERGATIGEFIFHGSDGSSSCTFSVSSWRLNKGNCNVSGMSDL